MSDRPLEELVNLGRSSARQLAEIGIKTEADLRGVGAVAAFTKLRRHFGSAINYNYLYALDGALKGVRWDLMPESEREILRAAAHAALAPPPAPGKRGSKAGRR